MYAFHFFLFLRTSGTMLNKSGNSGHPCLVLSFRGKAFSLSSLNMLVVSFFIDDRNQVEEVPLYSYLTDSFHCEL